MPSLSTLLARSAMLLAFAASAPAHGGVIYMSKYGVATDHVVTFNLDTRPANGAAAGSLYAEEGVLFSGAARVNSCGLNHFPYAAIRGNYLTTLGAGCKTGAADEQFTLVLGQAVERFTMSLLSTDLARGDQFTLFREGSEVASFQLSSLRYYVDGDCADPLGCVTGMPAKPQGFLVIDGTVFDELRFSEAGRDSSYLVFDNLGYDVAREVAEPPLLPLMGALLAALGVVRARRRARA
jgi:hypothetical protein